MTLSLGIMKLLLGTARGAEHQPASGRRFKLQPAAGEHPQEMDAQKKQDVRADGSHRGEHAVSPCAHFGP
jgi:hypothetical protein